MVATAPPAAAATHDGPAHGSHASGRPADHGYPGHSDHYPSPGDGGGRTAWSEGAQPGRWSGHPGHSQDVREAADMPPVHDGRSSRRAEDWSSGQAAVRPVTTTTTTTTAVPRPTGKGSDGSVGHAPAPVPPATVPAPPTTGVPASAPQATVPPATRVSTPSAARVTIPPTTVQVKPAVVTAVPVPPVLLEPAPRPVTPVPARPAGSSVKGAPAVKAPPTPPPVVRPAPETFPGAFGEPMVLARGAWQGLSLRAATDLKIPIGMLVGVALFLLVQALIDRRDPKVSAAPERGTDDTIGFE